VTECAELYIQMGLPLGQGDMSISKDGVAMGLGQKQKWPVKTGHFLVQLTD